MVKEDSRSQQSAVLKEIHRETTASHKFITILALVSIVGFGGIVSETIFNYSIYYYIESLWMVIIGVGLILEGEVSKLGRIKSEGLTPTNFTKLITVIIGILALLAGFFSIPNLRIETPGFLAVKGVLSIIAIIIIAVQTWLVK